MAAPCAWAGAYYNLGAFWKGPSGPISCSTIALVQSVPSGALVVQVQGTVAQQTITQTAGNLIVAAAFWDSDILGTPVSVSDTAGNVWQSTTAQFKFGTNNSVYSAVQVFYAENVPGGSNTITLTVLPPYNSAMYVALNVAEYSGVATSSALDTSNGQVGSAAVTTATLPNLTTASGPSGCKELVVGAFINDGNGVGNALLAGSGWTSLTHDIYLSSLLEDNTPALAAPASVVNASATWTGGDATWAGVQLAFRPAGSSTPAGPTQLAITTSSQTLATTWTCSGALTVEARNAGGAATAPHDAIALTLSGSGLAYYADSGCQYPITSSQIPAGATSQTVYFEGAAVGTPTVTIGATGMTSVNQSETISALHAFTWTGGGGCNGAWSTAACWSGGIKPGSSQTAIFDGNCPSNCTATLGADDTIQNLAMHAVAGAGDTLNLNGHKLTVNGDVEVDGGTLTMAGTLLVQDGFTVSGGTVNTAGSTLQFYDPVNVEPIWTLKPGSVVYDNVTFLDDTSTTGTFVKRYIAPGQSLTVAGTLTLDCVSDPCAIEGGGKVIAMGNVTVGDLGAVTRWGDPQSWLVIGGAGNQLIDASGTSNAYLPSLEIASTGGTVQFKGTPYIAGHYRYTSGALDFSTFSSTLGFKDPFSCDPTWNVEPGNVVYGKVTIAEDTVSSCNYVERSIVTGQTMTVGGTLTLAGLGDPDLLIGGGTLAARGDVVVQNVGAHNLDRTPMTLKIAGSSDQLIDVSATSTAYLPSLEIASTGGTVKFKGTTKIENNFKFTSGTLDFTTFGAVLGFSDPFNCNPSWTIDPGTGNYGNVSFLDDSTSSCFSVTRTLQSGSTMSVGGNLVLGGVSDPELLEGGTLAVTGNVTVQSAGADTTSNITIGGNFTSNNAFSASAGTVSFTAGASHAITGTNTFFGLSMDDSTVATADTLTFPSSKTQTVNGTFFLKGNATNRLKVKSSTGGTQATITPAANSTLGGNLDVQDLKRGGTHTITTGAGSIGPNSGACAPAQNVTNWACP